ncbi:PfkB family carbohydrate kinase [Microbispora sp. ZYX-F-249]|uniref:PfkB family carbohydrate kinase n=1 Tax=Microbispora maris TaxID=3144104 RepID=A0ABV0ALQ2_9ACTN
MRLCGVGDNVVDRYLDLGLVFPGGSACNVAVHARRLGAEAAYLGSIGSDPAGDLVRHSLAAEGVEARWSRYGGHPTPRADVKLDADGNRTFVDYVPPTEDLRLSPADLDYLASFDLVHTGHTSLVEDQLPDIARVTKVSFDFSYKDMEYARDLLPSVAVAFFSRARLDRPECAEFAASVLALGPREVVVTCGDQGALLASADRTVWQPAVPTEAVDTLGAGDAFAAQLLVALPVAPAEVAMARAAAYAASVCRHHGGYGYPADLDALYPPEETS